MSGSAPDLIVERQETVLSPWVTLVARTVLSPQGSGVYHSLRQADYVNVVAETAAGQIVLVEQFRSAVECFTLELPGGLLEANEAPLDCAMRELAEEAGFRASEPLVPLGSFLADPGRLENRIWGYYAGRVEAIPGWQPENGVTRKLLAGAEVMTAIRSERFNGLHVGLLALAALRGMTVLPR